MKFAFVIVVVLAAAGCATVSPDHLAALDGRTGPVVISDAEAQLLGDAHNFHASLERKGLIYREASAEAYVNRIATAILPTLATGAIRYHVYIVKDASVNAFALPNGTIYLNAGLVAKLDSEAKLAFVLAHEGAHVLNRHTFKGVVDRRGSVAGAHVADILLLGTGIAYLAAAQHLMSFSREMEAEADREAVTYLAATSYDVRDSIKVFNLLREVKHEKETASVWSSHPESSERIRLMQAHLGANPDDYRGTDRFIPEYEAFRRPLAELAVRLRLLNQQFELAEDAAKEELRKHGESAVWLSYLADALYGKGTFPDAAAREYAWLYDRSDAAALAEKFEKDVAANLNAAAGHFARALEIEPRYAPAMRGRGLTAYKQRDFQAASRFLHAYLETPDIKDRKYIESVLEKIPR